MGWFGQFFGPWFGPFFGESSGTDINVEVEPLTITITAQAPDLEARRGGAPVRRRRIVAKPVVNAVVTPAPVGMRWSAIPATVQIDTIIHAEALEARWNMPAPTVAAEVNHADDLEGFAVMLFLDVIDFEVFGVMAAAVDPSIDSILFDGTKPEITRRK